MALITCKECGKDHTDTIESCPHCGYQRNVKTKPSSPPEKKKKKSGCGTWVLILVITVVVISIIAYIARINDRGLPTNISTSNSGYERKEYMYVHKTVNLREGPGTSTEIVSQITRGSKLEILEKENNWYEVKLSDGKQGFVSKDLLKSNPLPKIEIADWSWQKDPSFGTNGTIIWMVELRNNTNSYIELVKVEISIYDKSGKLTDSDFMYVKSLAPGGTASNKGYATYYGTEEKASIRIVN